ncbi:MAG TPA: hypothetical protein VM282_11000 [Acidimicrobiales bacterium]|nr:hypothetical protein [Acidimicrobiales bacterium]
MKVTGLRVTRGIKPLDAVAGAALAVIVAIPLRVVAWLAWTGDFRAGRVSMLTGLALVGWIALQLAFLREFPRFNRPTW